MGGQTPDGMAIGESRRVMGRPGRPGPSRTLRGSSGTSGAEPACRLRQPRTRDPAGLGAVYSSRKLLESDPSLKDPRSRLRSSSPSPVSLSLTPSVHSLSLPLLYPAAALLRLLWRRIERPEGGGAAWTEEGGGAGSSAERGRGEDGSCAGRGGCRRGAEEGDDAGSSAGRRGGHRHGAEEGGSASSSAGRGGWRAAAPGGR